MPKVISLLDYKRHKAHDAEFEAKWGHIFPGKSEITVAEAWEFLTEVEAMNAVLEILANRDCRDKLKKE